MHVKFEKFDCYLEKNAKMQDFPEYFASHNKHFVLFQSEENTWRLEPMNQLDWFYSISKLEDGWIVYGHKEAWRGPAEEICEKYVFDGESWTISESTK